MIIKVNNGIEYEVTGAAMVEGKVVAARTDGSQLTIIGINDLSNLEVIGGEIIEEATRQDEIEAQVTYTAMMTGTLLDFEEE